MNMNAATDDNASHSASDNHLPDPAHDITRVIEAILFASADPLSVEDLYARLPDGADLGDALSQLQATYKGRGIELVQIDRCWAFRTAPDLSEALTAERTVEKKMSSAALETLAIIAYHQPVTRAEIENIRGVSTSRGTLDLLIDAGWVKPGRRRETPGRPLTWITTTAFLDHFALENLVDLPGLDDLKASGLLDSRPAIDALGHGDLFGDQIEADELEKDLTQVRQESLEKQAEEAHE